jgi:uncharacterized membrane protein YhfC
METETIDYSLTLASGAPEMIMAGGILALSVFVVMFIIIKKRWNAKILPFFIGLFMFTLARIFVMLVESAFSLVPSIDAVFEYNPTALTIIDCVLATFGYMAARWGNAKFLQGKYESQGDVLISGLGIGFGDALLFGFTTISNYVWCIAIDNNTLSQAFEGLSESEALTTFQSLSDLFYAPSILWLLVGAGTVIDIVMHVLLTATIFGTVKGNLPSMWHAVCAIIYLASTVSFQVYTSTSITSIAVCFAVKVVIFVATAFYLSKFVLTKVRYTEHEK